MSFHYKSTTIHNGMCHSPELFADAQVHTVQKSGAGIQLRSAQTGVRNFAFGVHAEPCFFSIKVQVCVLLILVVIAASQGLEKIWLLWASPT